MARIPPHDWPYRWKFSACLQRPAGRAGIVLLLHGGPGFTHEYLEAFDSFFPAAGVEYYYYDQLGSYYSLTSLSRAIPLM
jgi:proline iminopeptidase